MLLALNVQAQFAEGNWRTDTARKSIDLRELLRGGPPKDGTPSIDKPRFIPSKDANWIAPKALVIALQIGDTAPAYPLQILMWHELVNDTVGETPVLVSYCPLCNSAIIFDRRVKDKTLEFGVSGMLRNSNMAMYDRQTDSLWQQIHRGRNLGAYTGSSLRMIASQTIPFDLFTQSYPGGVVLSRDTGGSPRLRVKSLSGLRVRQRPHHAGSLETQDDAAPNGETGGAQGWQRLPRLPGLAPRAAGRHRG